MTLTAPAPTARRSLSSLSLSLAAPSASTASASRPAVTTRMSSLCTLSARQSTLNSSVAWAFCRRERSWRLKEPKAVSGLVREEKMADSDSERRAVSGRGAFRGSESAEGYKGGTVGSGGLAMDCHADFWDFRLGGCQHRLGI